MSAPFARALRRQRTQVVDQRVEGGTDPVGIAAGIEQQVRQCLHGGRRWTAAGDRFHAARLGCGGCRGLVRPGGAGRTRRRRFRRNAELCANQRQRGISLEHAQRIGMPGHVGHGQLARFQLLA
ncbi:hypothetical protein [Cupriavidus sp. H18C1]|uniref:hypothetical protein n=1 Tax=Cupriavidus sp. H18C1 TaxID=3241601 RepID=UPI003BB88190